MIVYIATSAPSLTDAAGWFSLFQNNRFVGLVDFGILELYALILFVPMFLALYAVLRRASESYMAIAAILAFVGIAVNFATSKLFSLLTLSDLYAAATTAAQKSQFLAAGQATLAVGALGGIGGSVEGGIPLAVSGADHLSYHAPEQHLRQSSRLFGNPGKRNWIGNVLQCCIGSSDGRIPILWRILLALGDMVYPDRPKAPPDEQSILKERRRKSHDQIKYPKRRKNDHTIASHKDG